MSYNEFINAFQVSTPPGRTQEDDHREEAERQAKASHPLATSEDLRYTKGMIYYPGWEKRIEALADALDRLHATPGIWPAMDRLESELAGWDADVRAGHYRTTYPDLREAAEHWRTVFSALRHLLPATPEQTNG